MKFGAKSKELEIQVDGYLFGIRKSGETLYLGWNNANPINSGGHLHDGGSFLHVSINGKLICDSQPTYMGQENGEKFDTMKEIVSMSRCHQGQERR
jgi:hypothetical protein